MRVSPVRETGEMVILHTEDSDYSLSAGRYEVLLGGQAYDFSVAGPVTEAAQCLERIEAANGTFYSECRTP